MGLELKMNCSKQSKREQGSLVAGAEHVEREEMKLSVGQKSDYLEMFSPYYY